MKLTFCFDKNKPFGGVFGAVTPDEHVRSYTAAVAAALRERFPDWDVEVRALDTPPGDVEFDPESELTDHERLELALEVKRIAKRISNGMLGDIYESKEE